MTHPLQAQVSRLNWQTLSRAFTSSPTLNKTDAAMVLTYVRGYHDFEFFVQTFFPHHCTFPFSKMHHDFCRAEADPARRGRRDVIAAPRGHAKTTFKLLFKVIHAIVYGYERFVVIIGHSAPEAEEKVQSILEELEQNIRLHHVYGELAPKRGNAPNSGQWGRKRFVTRNGIRVMAKTRGTQIRGAKYQSYRPSLIICDDIESPEGVLTPEQRQKTRDWFFKDVLKAGGIDGGTNVTVIGTCLHPQSLLMDLLTSPGWTAQKYQAIESFSHHPEHWETFKQYYIDLTNPCRERDALAYFETHQEAMLAGTEVLWPDGESYLRLMTMRIVEGEASFLSEKQNDPCDPERQLFRQETIRQFNLDWTGPTSFQLQVADPHRVLSRQDLERIVAFHDPALGKRPGQSGEPDFAAIVVVGKDRDGYLYCLDAWIEKSPPSRQVEQAFLMHQRWGFDTLYLETNHFQDLLRQTYDDARQGYPGCRLRIQGVHQHHNKHQRISTLEPLISNGFLQIARSVTPRLLEQLILFPTSYDDGPDALHGAVAQLKNLSSMEFLRRFYQMT